MAGRLSRQARGRMLQARGGFTLVEAAVTAGLLALVAVVSMDGLASLSTASRRGVAEQEAARQAGALLDRIARELRFASAASVDCSTGEPVGQITFQEVLAYEADPDTPVSRVLSRPITLRTVVANGSSSLLVLERSEADSWSEGTLVAICRTDEEGSRTTLAVPVSQLDAYLAEGATLGPCDTDPIPLAGRRLGASTTLLGGPIARRDAEDATLPGLNFLKRPTGGTTFIDIALTVRVSIGGETVTRRLSTSVGLVNR